MPPLTVADILKAAKNARTAIRRRDLAAAQRWLDLAERVAALRPRLEYLAQLSPGQREQGRP
jgi:hypothetical protein